MTIDEILNLGHISSSEVPNYTRIQTEDGYYMTAWTEGDDIRKYAGSNVYYLPVRENYDYPDLRVITVEEHKRLSAERDAELEINPLVIVLKPQEKEVLITSNGDTIVTPDSGFNGLTEVNISVDVPIPTFETETLTVELTDNGTYNYTPTTDGYSSVEVTVDVACSGGLVVPFEEIGYPTDLKDKLNNELNSKPFSDLEYSKSLYDAWNPTTTSAYDKYKGNNKLVYCPLIYTGNVTNMASMLRDCISLTTVPLLNTRKVTDMSYMFYGCSLLTDVPLFNTSNVKNMSYMFYNCSSLTTIPLLDMSSVTNMGDMFSNCSSLTTIPLLDTSNVTRMSYMFSSCSKLTSIPQLDTSNVTNMSSMFGGCYQLTTIPLLDMSSVTKMNSIFGYSDLTKLTDLGGFKNLGMQSNITGTNDNYFLYKVPNMTYESAMNIINNLYDRASAGYSVLTLKFNSKTLALLSEDDIAIATNKGWTLS